MEKTSQTLNNGFSKRLCIELDRLSVPKMARPKILSELTGKSVTGARKWLTADSIPKGVDLDLLCETYDLDLGYILLGTRTLKEELSPPTVNVVLQSTVFLSVYKTAQKIGIDVHNQEHISEKALAKVYQVLMTVIAKSPDKPLDEDLIKALLV